MCKVNMECNMVSCVFQDMIEKLYTDPGRSSACRSSATPTSRWTWKPPGPSHQPWPLQGPVTDLRWQHHLWLHLNCSSHVSVKTNFWRFICYISLNHAQTHLDHLKVLDELEATFQWDWIWQQIKNFPIDTNCKHRLLSATLWRCLILMKFCPRVSLKPSIWA